MVSQKSLLVSDPEELALRSFLSYLAREGRRPLWLTDVPRQLNRLAVKVLRSVPVAGQLDDGDLVGLLLIRLLEQKERRGPEAIEELLGENVRSLGAVLRHRMRQIATEYVPGRKLRRELRVHVRAALEDPRAGLACRPESLLVGERYSAACVAQAVRWLLSEDVPPDVRELERHLVAEFNLGTEHVAFEAAPDGSGRTRDPSASLVGGHADAEAVVTARALRTLLGEERSRLLGRRLGGSTIQELARQENAGLATIHERLRRAEEVTGAYFSEAEVSPRIARESLRLLRRE